MHCIKGVKIPGPDVTINEMLIYEGRRLVEVMLM